MNPNQPRVSNDQADKGRESLHLEWALDSRYLSLGALCWAASGKDPGLSPLAILEEAKRSARFSAPELQALDLSTPVDPPALKQQWLGAVQRAQTLLDALPAGEAGCLYLQTKGQAINPDPSSPDFPGLTRHYGSLRGAWPTIRTG